MSTPDENTPQPEMYPLPPQMQPGQWQTEAPPRGGGGLGTATLVLGIVSIVLLVACGIGILTAVAGIVVGIIALIKGSNRTRAIVGLVLSGLTLVLAVVFGVWLFNVVRDKNLGECFDTTLHPTQESSQKCLEHKLNGDISGN
ncbi:DUF4190 domain-containing protein [Streptosporangiaceae bacterium NEAU-GS5]|nr:DUF4190 domain-containing protein [Streptosporangiaceae bacterium NEAU-GS5]